MLAWKGDRAVPIWEELLLIVAAYGLGCFMTAYYLVRLRTGQDIRTLGSGNVGGRNAGRVLGPVGFALVAVGDAAKGLLATLAAIALSAPPWVVVLVMIAVVAGHMWPAQLRFHGGKGIATMLGALIGYNILIALLIVGLFLFLFAIFRSLTIGGLLAIALTPFALIALGQPLTSVVALAIMAVLVVFAHRTNIRARLPGRAPTSEAR
jgi:acyl phosphate:glycerol-3-phosphate acyltransferase